jgi:protein-tyrosine phosphatase
MIDLHNHILWGTDDGARTLGDSLAMCRIAYNDGIRTIVATPHTLNGLYQNDRPLILAKVRKLNEVISNQLLVTRSTTDKQPRITNNKSTIANRQSAITILPGADVHLCEKILPQLDEGKITTLGDRGKYLLIEFPLTGIPYGAEGVLHQLISKGIIPIITHPERNLEVKRNPKRYLEMNQMGCLGQVTAMSLTGGFGPGSKRLAEQLLSKGLVHIIASDAHSTDGRPPILSDGVCAAGKIVGREEALRMVTEYPQAILEGRRLDIKLMQRG